MATHGFIEIGNENVVSRTLIHAVHDGYFIDMISDIITLPFFMASNFKKSKIVDIVPDFLKCYNRTHRDFISKMLLEDSKNYSDLIKKWEMSIPFDDMRYTLPSYLIAKRPDKYQIVNEPFIVYGHPIKDGDIRMLFNENRLSTVVITYNLIDEENTESILELINDMNNIITESSAKIKFFEKSIIMNYDKIIADLCFYKKI